MFNQCNRCAKFVIHIQYKSTHIFLFFQIHPGHRFVQQKQLGLSSQRPTQFDPLLQAIGQPSHRNIANRLDFEKINNTFNPFAVLYLLALCRTIPEHVPEQIGFHLDDPPRHQIIQCGHTLEQGDILECS